VQTNFGDSTLQNKLHYIFVKTGTEEILYHLGQAAEMQSGPVKFLQTTLLNLCRQILEILLSRTNCIKPCETRDRNISGPPGPVCRNANWTG